MAHQISIVNGRAEAAYKNTPAWHGLGRVIAGITDSDAMRDAAGLTWEPEKHPLFASVPSGDDARSMVEVPGQYAVCRSDNNGVLGVVGENYRVFGNRRMFEFLDALQKDNVMQYESAGALKGGQIIWALAKMPADAEIVPGDTVMQYALITSHNNGNGGIHILPTNTRVVCWNTLTAAIDGNRPIWHTHTMEQKLVAAHHYLSQFSIAFSDYVESGRALARKAYTQADAIEFFARMFPIEADASKAAQTIRETTTNKILENLGSHRNTIGGIDGTFWSLYNATTEYFDHQAKYLGKNELAASEQRMVSTLLGPRAEQKRQALSVAKELAGV